jgi:hypothetical protein
LTYEYHGEKEFVMAGVEIGVDRISYLVLFSHDTGGGGSYSLNTPL